MDRRTDVRLFRARPGAPRDPRPVRVLGWTAAVAALAFLPVALVIAVAQSAGAPDAVVRWGGALLVVDVCLAFGAWVVWGLVSTNLVEHGRWALGSTRRERTVRWLTVATSGTVALLVVPLALGGVLLTGAVDPEGPAGRRLLTAVVVTGITAGALVVLGIIVAAVAGAVVLGGPWAAGIGLAFVAGFALAVAGHVRGDVGQLVGGWTMLGLSVLGYAAVGMRGGSVPLRVVAAFGTWGALATGAVMLVVGLTTDRWPVWAAGTLTAASFLGIRVGARLTGRAAAAQAPPPVRRPATPRRRP